MILVEPVTGRRSIPTHLHISDDAVTNQRQQSANPKPSLSNQSAFVFQTKPFKKITDYFTIAPQITLSSLPAPPSEWPTPPTDKPPSSHQTMIHQPKHLSINNNPNSYVGPTSSPLVSIFLFTSIFFQKKKHGYPSPSPPVGNCFILFRPRNVWEALRLQAKAMVLFIGFPRTTCSSSSMGRVFLVWRISRKKRMHVIISVPTKKGENKFLRRKGKDQRLPVQLFVSADIMLVLYCTKKDINSETP